MQSFFPSRPELKTLMLVAIVMVVANQGLAWLGSQYFHASEKKLVQELGQGPAAREEAQYVADLFLQNHLSFHDAVSGYFLNSSTLLAAFIALLIFAFMTASLFMSFFGFFPRLAWLAHGGLLRLIESIPHSLVVMLVYFLYLAHPELPLRRNALLLCYALISLPLVHSLVKDRFHLAQREGHIENYLILPLKNRVIVQRFLGRQFGALVLGPFFVLTALMVFWDFSFASIGIWSGQDDAPQLFMANFTHVELVNFSLHDTLVFFQIAFFSIWSGGLVYYYAK